MKNFLLFLQEFYEETKMAGIYIHIPICKSRCIYCDFYSTTATDKQQDLANALIQEMELRKDYLCGQTVNTIYFGGGTPSAMRINQISIVINSIRNFCNLSQKPEITLEANPDDLNSAYLKELRTIGVNRLSIGIQSFNDRILNFINRRHNAQQAISAAKNAQEAGFSNISIDLIYGFPGQSTEMWKQELAIALKLHVQHISAYGLTYEEGTVLQQKATAGTIEPTGDEKMNEMYDILVDTLQAAGYEQYEVSNFALQGFRSAHNSAYWNGTPYLGLGPAAHSFDGMARQWNINSLNDYICAIRQGKTCFENETLTTENRYNEYIMLSLRTVAGINLQQLEESFGTKYLNHCTGQAESYLNSGCLVLKNGHLAATRKGIKILNLITEELLDA